MAGDAQAERSGRTPEDGSDVVLDVRNLSVDYGAGRGAVRAVNDVSLRLHRGEVLGVAGESGSGKSTLAYAITRLIHAPGRIAGGEVVYFGRGDRSAAQGVDVLELDRVALQRFRWAEIAIVFQAAMNALSPVLTLQTQVTDVLKAHTPGMTKPDRIRRGEELLRLVGIPIDRMSSYPHELSGGMRQRAVIAIALALNPDIIVMDEPTTALDVVMQRQILADITRLRDTVGFSVILITHDVSLLVEIADSVCVMYGGKVVETAAARELYRSPRHPYSHGLLRSFPHVHGARRPLLGIPGSPVDLRRPPTGCAFHPRCDHAFAACSEVTPTLRHSGLDADSPRHEVSCLLYEGQQPPPFSLDEEETARGV